MLFLVPLAVAGLGGLAYLKKKSDKAAVMSGERKFVYEAALLNMKDPVKLRVLADAFAGEGLTPQAELLRKRATLRELSPEMKAARREAFRKGMNSKDPNAIEALANAFWSQGATGAATALRKYCDGLRVAAASVHGKGEG